MDIFRTVDRVLYIEIINYYSEEILLIGDHLPLVLVAALLAVTGGDRGPGGAAAGVIDGVDHGLSPGQGDLQLDAGDGGPVELGDGSLRALNPLICYEPAVLLNLHGYIDNLAVLSERGSK